MNSRPLLNLTNKGSLLTRKLRFWLLKKDQGKSLEQSQINFMKRHDGWINQPKSRVKSHNITLWTLQSNNEWICTSFHDQMNLARITAVKCMEKWTKIQQSDYKAGCSSINLARLNLLSVVDVRIIQEIVEALRDLTSRYMLPTSDELKYSSNQGLSLCSWQTDISKYYRVW